MCGCTTLVNPPQRTFAGCTDASWPKSCLVALRVLVPCCRPPHIQRETCRAASRNRPVALAEGHQHGKLMFDLEPEVSVRGKQMQRDPVDGRLERHGAAALPGIENWAAQPLKHRHQPSPRLPQLRLVSSCLSLRSRQLAGCLHLVFWLLLLLLLLCCIMCLEAILLIDQVEMNIVREQWGILALTAALRAWLGSRASIGDAQCCCASSRAKCLSWAGSRDARSSVSISASCCSARV